MKHLILPVFFGFSLCLLGCSGGPEFAPVTGKVTYNSKPLGNVRVEFWPEGNGMKSTAVTDSEGRFTLMSEDGQREGAMVGTHRIVLKDLDMYGKVFLGRKAENVQDMSGGKKPRFPQERYADAHTTPMKQTVESGKNNNFDLEIK